MEEAYPDQDSSVGEPTCAHEKDLEIEIHVREGYTVSVLDGKAQEPSQCSVAQTREVTAEQATCQDCGEEYTLQDLDLPKQVEAAMEAACRSVEKLLGIERNTP